MLWIIIVIVSAAFTIALYSCLIAGKRADEQIEKYFKSKK